MKVAILTSSRADYGIYNSLLVLLSKDDEIDLHVICFGMHVTKKFGYTAQQVLDDNYGHIHVLPREIQGDQPFHIANYYGELSQDFAQFWGENTFDLIFALGDRFEMSAAVQAALPFEMKFAHIHGGETTEGAIDNIYRHQISLASSIHFVANQVFKDRLNGLLNGSDNVHVVGSLSLDGLDLLELPSWEEVREAFMIPNEKFVLVTFHPETVSSDRNEFFSQQAELAIQNMLGKFHIVITLSNADTMGGYFIDMAQNLKSRYSKSVTLVDTFGKLNYFAAMKNAAFLLGNTSSGILEAASFNKYVINIGERQSGRLRSNNVIDVPFDAKEISKAIDKIGVLGNYNGVNVYKTKDTAMKIVENIKYA